MKEESKFFKVVKSFVPFAFWVLTQILALIAVTFAIQGMYAGKGYSAEQINDIVNSNVMIVTLLAGILNIGVYYLLVRGNTDKPVIKKENAKRIIMCMLMGIGCFMIINGIIKASDLISLVPSYEKTLKTLSSGNLMVRILSLCILTPISEELLFRGIMYNRLKKCFDVKTALFIQAIVFALLHLNLVQSTYAFICALALGYLYEKTDNLFTSILCHIGVNSSNLIFDISILGFFSAMPTLMILVGILVFTGTIILFRKEYSEAL